MKGETTEKRKKAKRRKRGVRGVYTRKLKRGTAVYITYSPPGEPRVRELFDNVPRGVHHDAELRDAKERAEMLLHKRRAAIVDGTHKLPPRQSMTLADFVEQHYKDELRTRRRNGRPMATAKTEIQRVTTGPVGRRLGSVNLSDLTADTLRRYVQDRQREDGRAGRPPGPCAINRDLARISDLWNAARRRNLVRGDNPCEALEREDEPKRERYLEPEEAARLYKELHPDLRRLVEVAAHTGIRRGALLGLRWRDVDLRRSEVRVPDNLSKNRKAYTVKLNGRLRAIFEELHSRGAYTGRDDVVFCKPDGSQRRSIRSAWETARERAGQPELRFHDLRHTAASWIVQSPGNSLYDAQKILGHRSAAMTERYAHLSDDHLQAVVQRAERYVAGIQPVTDLALVRAEREAENAPVVPRLSHVAGDGEADSA